jgi:hypothetical protein
LTEPSPHGVPAVGTAAATFTVQGPVLAEICVLVLGEDGEIRLTGPCGPEPWFVEVAAAADPTSVVTSLTRGNLGQPLVVHSTSWRQDRSAVVLTFVAVMPAETVDGLASVPVGRAQLARGEAAAAPARIESAQVVEHALRHLAWLIRDDAVVAERLGPPWQQALVDYAPEPFRSLG